MPIIELYPFALAALAFGLRFYLSSRAGQINSHGIDLATAKPSLPAARPAASSVPVAARRKRNDFPGDAGLTTV